MGLVELGCVTGKRPAIDGAFVGPAAINKLVLELQESHPGGTPESQLQCLQMDSSSFWSTPCRCGSSWDSLPIRACA